MIWPRKSQSLLPLPCQDPTRETFPPRQRGQLRLFRPKVADRLTIRSLRFTRRVCSVSLSRSGCLHRVVGSLAIRYSLCFSFSPLKIRYVRYLSVAGRRQSAAVRRVSSASTLVGTALHSHIVFRMADKGAEREKKRKEIRRKGGQTPPADLCCFC